MIRNTWKNCRFTPKGQNYFSWNLLLDNMNQQLNYSFWIKDVAHSNAYHTNKQPKIIFTPSNSTRPHFRKILDATSLIFLHFSCFVGKKLTLHKTMQWIAQGFLLQLSNHLNLKFSLPHPFTENKVLQTPNFSTTKKTWRDLQKHTLSVYHFADLHLVAIPFSFK